MSKRTRIMTRAGAQADLPKAESEETEESQNINNNSKHAKVVKSRSGARDKIRARSSDKVETTSQDSQESDLNDGRKVHKSAKRSKVQGPMENLNCNQDDIPEQDSEEHCFSEDGNFVKMKVNAAEDNFTSEEEEGEIESDRDGNERSLDGSDMDTDLSSSKAETTESETEDNSETEMKKCRKCKSKKRKHKRASSKKMEEKVEYISNTLFAMQNMMLQKGMFGNNGQDTDQSDQVKTKASVDNKEQVRSVNFTNSDTTIYRNAVEREQQVADDQMDQDSEVFLNIRSDDKIDKTQQLSSDERADTSEEINNVTDQFIADCTADVEQRRSKDSSMELTRP